MTTSLDALQSWYQMQCDGEWEHQYGIEIETLDNPGWAVEVDLAGTKLSGKSLPEMTAERSETDWFRCSVEAGRFKGFGGPTNLTEILEVFLGWAEAEQ